MHRIRAAAAALASALTLAVVVPTSSASAADRQFTWPSYRYVLTTRCYCPPDAPVRITVRNGYVVTAVFTANDAQHHHAGDPAPRRYRKTIAGLLHLARSDRVARSVIRWPASRPAPSSIYLDYNTQMVDEEVSYTLGWPVRLAS